MKKYLNKNRQELRKIFSVALMDKIHHYKEGENPAEWEEFNPDSQLNMTLEDVDVILDVLFPEEPEAMTGVVYPESTITMGATGVTGVTGTTGTTGYSYYGFQKEESKVGQKANKKVEVLTEIHVNLERDATLKDFKEFISVLDSLKVSEDFVVADSGLSVTIAIDNCKVEKVDCGVCNVKDYLILPEDHHKHCTT
jgi:hypothetical protein